MNESPRTIPRKRGRRIGFGPAKPPGIRRLERTLHEDRGRPPHGRLETGALGYEEEGQGNPLDRQVPQPDRARMRGAGGTIAPCRRARRSSRGGAASPSNSPIGGCRSGSLPAYVISRWRGGSSSAIDLPEFASGLLDALQRYLAHPASISARSAWCADGPPGKLARLLRPGSRPGNAPWGPPRSGGPPRRASRRRWPA